MKKSTTHNLTVAAMLSAVAFILMFIEFPIPMLGKALKVPKIA